MTANLKDQKGYIIEVQGFSTGAGQAGMQSSQAMANSVVRYLVEKNDIPVYRIFVMGMGNAKLPAAEGNDQPRTRQSGRGQPAEEQCGSAGVEHAAEPWDE